MMNDNCNKFFDVYGNYFLRIVVGAIFIIAGYGKLFGAPGISGFTGMLDGLGYPIPGVLAIIVGIIELVGGIFLLVGFWTRESASLLAIVMLLAILTFHLGQGWAGGLRYPLLLLAVLTTFIGRGDVGGLFCNKKKAKAAAPAASPAKSAKKAKK